VLAASVAAKEKAILDSTGSLSNFHPPNLHQAPPLSQTHGLVTPLYSIAPAPMGVAYYGLSDTTGTLQGTTVNTTSLAGTWKTTDPIGTAAELFDTSSGNAAGEFGAQLNTVLVNVTLGGQTSFGPNDNTPFNGCENYNNVTGNPLTTSCPNEFWLQNYIEYTEATHTLTISNEIWNFSNPAADFVGGSSTLVGFGSVEDSEVYQGPSSGTITVAPPFSLALYLNYTQGPCHTDSVAGTGVPSCGVVSTSHSVNELFMNYTVRNSAGVRECPTSIPAGRLCGEDDNIFFNSVLPTASSGVPLYGPCLNGAATCSPQTPLDARVGSATIQANGTAYDPVGLTNDFEFDYGIGSDDGATNNIVYQDGIVGLGYCANGNAAEGLSGGISCSSYSPPPAAVDYGGETGETSTGEVAYWAPQGVQGPGPTLQTGTATPITYLDTGPSLLLGLWNMSGSLYTGHAPYPANMGGEPLSYQNIAPANAWVGVAAGFGATSQSQFQVAPTFGWYSYWKGSGGSPTPTTLGANLWLPTGKYTIEVLLSGYTPYIGNVDLTTSGQSPSITLSPNATAGVYTPLWAFSNRDLANISVNNNGGFGLGGPGNPYDLVSGTPTVGAPFGTAGSLSWLFSNLNDYLFTVWIGEFINSTTAYAQSNPAPSFVMDYPSWQFPSLDQFNVPTTDQFQFYLYHVQNFTLAGASHIYSWANSEATTLYSVICNTCENDLFADNTFAVSNLGMEFIDGGTALPVDPAMLNTRNVVWGNTFSPDPQTAFTGLETPSTGLTLSENFDRVYNNEFYTNGTVSASTGGRTPTVYEAWWNVTCQPGYAPLSQATYPGTVVCQSASYVTSYLGFSLSGSIIGTGYQGGNFWFNYGNSANPYANLPYVARSTSITSTAAIQSTAAGARGDYAPLIAYNVYDPNFAETGIPSSATASAFEVQVFGGPGSVWANETQTATPTATCSSNPCVVFYLPSGTYTYYGFSTLTGASQSAANPSTGSFTVSGAPYGLVSTFAFSASKTVTFTESGLPTGTVWSISIPGQPTVTGKTTTLTYNLPNGAYTYTVGAVPGYATASPSGSFSVTGSTVGISVPFYPTLTSPATPSVSATALDVDQTLTVSGTIPTTGVPTYSWSWLVSVNGGSFAATTLCAVNSGSGAAAGASETCSVAGGSLTVGDTYAFELQVTDSASTPETQTSASSATVSVASMLTAPAAPTVSATTLDSNQGLTVSGTTPTTGTAPYAWTWLEAVNGGSFATATVCAANGGSGASGGASEVCTVSGGTLTAGDTYAFELKVSDSATAAETQTSTTSPTVTVSSALSAPGAPTVSATALDEDQTLTVSGTISSTGTAPYSWSWLVSVNGGAYSAETQCAVNGGSGASAGAPVTCSISGGSLTVGDTYAFELQVTDSAQTAQTQTSVASPTVTVYAALSAPSTPVVSATALDVNQALTVTATTPSTGVSPYAWSWLVSVNGGSFSTATQCAANSGTGAASDSAVVCSIASNSLTVGSTYAFELTVTDSASTAETQTSSASATVTVASALTAPAAPTVSATTLDADQTLTVSGTVPSTGTAPVSWTWLVSINGGSFTTATQCASNSGSGSGPVSCTISGGTLSGGNSYAFELSVTDSATASESQTSGASPTVSVASALAAPSAPTVSATALDVNQALTVSDTLPTSGTGPYAWGWLESVNGGAYAATTICSTNSGTGGTGGASVTCSIAASALTAGSTYRFELTVTDSAQVAETQTSSASPTVTVSSVLKAASGPKPNNPALDVNQVLSVTSNLPTTGTAPYSWTWLVSVNSGAYVTATQCSVDSGSGAASGVKVTCSVPANTLVVGSYYNFEVRVTDSATAPETTTSAASLNTVTVKSALVAPAAPTVSATALDTNQALTVSGVIPTTGTGPYAWTWEISVNSGSYVTATQCSTNSGSGATGGATVTCVIAANTLASGDHYNFKLKVSDSATSSESQTSAASAQVKVKTALGAPAKPTVSSTRLDVAQTLTVSGAIPGSGSSPLSWQWLVSVNGGSYVSATQCAVNSGSGASEGASVTCSVAGGTLTVGDTYSFELQVTDGATVAETQTSAASKTVTVVS
jgi:Thermopsin